MDVQSALNGLPQSTKPYSDHDQITDTANFAASMSNAENTISPLPPKPALNMSESDQTSSVQPALNMSESDQTSSVQPALNMSESDQTSSVQPALSTTDSVDGPHPEQGVLSLPSEQGPQESSSSIADKPVNGLLHSDATTSMTGSFQQPSGDQSGPTPLAEPDHGAHTVSATSVAVEAPFQMIATQISEAAPTQVLEPLPEAVPSMSQPPLVVSALLNQPISDVRSASPQGNTAGIEDMVDISREVPEQINDMGANDALVTGANPTSIESPVEQVEPSGAVILDAMDTATDSSPAVETSLPSPPPAPQPAPATLPSDQPSESVRIPPAEHPIDPAPTPVAPISAPDMIQSVDLPMEDVSSPPTKIAHEREDDEDESQPLSKRAKTEEVNEQTKFKVPDAPSSQSPAPQDASSTAAAFNDADGSITPSRLQHMKKVISNLKKSNASAFFRVPVDPIALNIPSYTEVIKQPMDLGTIDNKLKSSQYTSVHDFIADFELIVANSATFNGSEHGVTQQAYKMKQSFVNQMASIPKASVAEPSKEERRAQKLKSEPTRSAPPRRPSVSTSVAPSGSARSPSGSGQTFAVGPEGVPLIRRDSTIQDGRPKRAIVPTKRNQNEFGGGRPKKKKYELQLRFCQEVLKELQAVKHWQINQYFLDPVDPVALNIPTYFQVIKKPMDLHTVQQRLEGNGYEKAKDFEEDVRLVFKNCYKFNPEGEWVNQAGHKLEEMFDKKWAQKDDWIASREPTSEAASDADEDDDEENADESEEEEEDESEDERQKKIVELQKQIEAMSKQMGELAQPVKKKKKSRSPTAVGKKSKSSKGKKERATTFPNLKPKEKDKKKSSKPKPEKEKFHAITLAEKQYISNGISQLPDKQMSEALKIIQQNVPALKNTHETEIELDIDEVPNHVLHKLLTFVKKYAGPPPPEVKTEVVYAPASSHGGVGRPKKSKPMSKEYQENQIAKLKESLGQYQDSQATSPSDGVQSIETGADSSDDDADSEESEEE